MFGFFKRTSDRKKYKQSVDDWVTLLFCGFPDLDLFRIKKKINYEGLVEHGFTGGDKPGEIGLGAALLLFQKFLIDIPMEQRLAAFDEITSNKWESPISIGINYFSQITAQMIQKGEIRPAEERLYLLQMVGALRGASVGELTSAWGTDELNRIIKR